MLEVLPIQTKIEQEAICARCGVSYDADCMAYSATIDGILTGICQFRMSDRGGVIRDLAVVQGQELDDRDRVESLFVLGRATLNFIDLCGVHFAVFEDETFLQGNEGLVRSIGFEKAESGRWEVDLNGFFNEPCQHGKAGNA